MPVAYAEHRGERFQNDGAEGGRHSSNAQRRDKESAAVHHRSRAAFARAALQVQHHLQAGAFHCK